jgi:hypothetical protein
VLQPISVRSFAAEDSVLLSGWVKGGINMKQAAFDLSKAAINSFAYNKLWLL